MDVTGSVYGGGVFCALIMMGLNVSFLPSPPAFPALTVWKYMIIVNMNTAGSRLMWSMARDKAFPFSDYFSKINQRFLMPLRAMMAVLVVDVLVGLLVLGSDLAFYAIISGGGVTLQLSYCIPILCVVFRGRSILPARPNFDLGKWGYAVNIISLLWSVIVVLFYCFPQFVPVVGEIANMNWATAILAGVVVFSGIYWAFKGRKKYLVNSNTVLDDTLVMIGDRMVVGRDAVRATMEEKSEKH
jgi:choline transport protein